MIILAEGQLDQKKQNSEGWYHLSTEIAQTIEQWGFWAEYTQNDCYADYDKKIISVGIR